MGKVMLRESILILLTGLVSWLLIPALLRQPPAAPLFLIGIVMGLTFAPMYGVGLLGGRKMPAVVRGWVGVFAWVLTFWMADFIVLLGLWRTGRHATGAALYLIAAPGLFGLVLAALGAWKSTAGRRLVDGLWALYAYSFPMAIVRFALVAMVKVNLVLATIALQAGALYMLAHGLIRLFAPVSVESDDAAEAGPLVRRRPVPDFVVGRAEGTLRRQARPFATLSDGGIDERAISFLVSAGEVEGTVQKLKAALAETPFAIEPGERVDQQVEVVVRPRA